MQPLSSRELVTLLEEDDLHVSKPPSSSKEVKTKKEQEWPSLKEEALYGLAGEIVKTIEPYTEADPVAVLGNLLTGFGNCVGQGPHYQVEQTNQHLRLFTVLVGQSAMGRKGQSWSTLRYLFQKLDPEWTVNRIADGLSSGEGLINEVRDAREEKKPIKGKDGRTVGYENQIVDHGVTDKRLLVMEGEFAQVLKVMAREGNILSPIIRKAWDSGELRLLTKNNPLRATGAHISLIGHIGRDELLRYLNNTEQGNGFGNRFIWMVVRRSKLISNPVGVPLSSLNSLSSQLREALTHAQQVGLMVRDTETEGIWDGVYPSLSEEKPGLLGTLIARASGQVMRLACIYALLDGSEKVKKSHLTAALAFWDYCESSARIIFGDSLGDHYADRIRSALQEVYPNSLTETEIWGLFGRHGGQRVELALKSLRRLGLAEFSRGKSEGGRAPILWRVCEKREKSPPDEVSS